MDQIDRELHPVYGAIPSDGEFVNKGEILGLSVDAKEVVLAPISGWVRLIPSSDSSDLHLKVHIHASRGDGFAFSPDSAA